MWVRKLRADSLWHHVREKDPLKSECGQWMKTLWPRAASIPPSYPRCAHCLHILGARERRLAALKPLQ